MIDAIATISLAVILIAFELQQRKLIKIAEKYSASRVIIALIVSIMLVILFWGKSQQSNVRVIAIIILVFGAATYRQGLGERRVITFGSIMSAGDYSRYEEIIVRPGIKSKSEVTFYGHKAGHYSIPFDVDQEQLRYFMKNHLPAGVKLLNDQQFQMQEEKRESEYRKSQENQLNAIRNRKRLSVKETVKVRKSSRN